MTKERRKQFPERYVPADGTVLVDERLGYLIEGFTEKGDVARPGERFHNAMWSRDTSGTCAGDPGGHAKMRAPRRRPPRARRHPHRPRRPRPRLALRLRLPRLRLRAATRPAPRPARALPQPGARMTAPAEQLTLSSRCMITIDFFIDEMWTDQQIAEHVLAHALSSVRDVVDLVRGRTR